MLNLWGAFQGLVTKARFDSLQEFKKPFAHEHAPAGDLVTAIKVRKHPSQWVVYYKISC